MLDDDEDEVYVDTNQYIFYDKLDSENIELYIMDTDDENLIHFHDYNGTKICINHEDAVKLYNVLPDVIKDVQNIVASNKGKKGRITMTDDFPYKFDIAHDAPWGDYFTIRNDKVTIPIPPRYIRGFAERLMNIIDQYEKESDSKIDEKIASLKEQIELLEKQKMVATKGSTVDDKTHIMVGGCRYGIDNYIAS